MSFHPHQYANALRSGEELLASIKGMDDARKRQLVARLRREKEVRRTSWFCDNEMCLGIPHDSMPVPHARKGQRMGFKPGDGFLGALYMAGRGTGKTRVGAEETRARVEKGQAGRIALIGRTAADVRDVMLEGESGLLAVYPRWERPNYQPSKRRVIFHNGAVGFCYSSDQPDLLRGPQHDLVWGDEVSTWRYLRLVLSNALFGLRLGKDPRAILTGTPRPTKDMKALAKGKLGNFKIMRGTTYENLSNLAPVFQELVISQFEGTRTGRQELNGELLEDVLGALLNIDVFEHEGFRPAKPQTDIVKIVIAVDPAVTSETRSDYTGITVFGVDEPRQYGYVLHSERLQIKPEHAMRRAAELYDQFFANYVVGEVNNGGDYVKTVLHQIRPDIPFENVRASVGKLARAEPVAMLYEQHRIRHVGAPTLHAALEDEWTGWVPKGTKDAEGNPIPEGDSPDVMDSCVWGATKLMLDLPQRVIGAVQKTRQ